MQVFPQNLIDQCKLKDEHLELIKDSKLRVVEDKEARVEFKVHKGVVYVLEVELRV